MIRVMLPSHLPVAGAGRAARSTLDVAGAGRRSGRCSTRSRRAIPCCAAPSATTSRARRRPFVRFFACEEDLSHESPDTPLPDAVAAGDEPFLVVGAMAGG